MIGRALRRALDRLRRPMQSRIGEMHDVRGFHVIVENARPDIATADVLARLDDALELIERFAPWRMAHMRRDVRALWVVRYPCRGAYVVAERACITELTFLARRDISAATVAASILHEGMHARMHAMGVRLDEASSARMERICRRVELDFGLALPPALGHPVIERARASLALEDDEVSPEIDWQEAMRRVGTRDREALLEGPDSPG